MSDRFHLTSAGLETLAGEMAGWIESQLQALQDGEVSSFLPSWVGRPGRVAAGEVLVVDVGGTRARAARMKLGRSGLELVSGPDIAAIGQLSSADDYFAFQARLCRDHWKEGIPLGYCFSNPTRSTADGDAELIGWTKEYHVPGTEGKKVGRLLRAAISAELGDISELGVINDSIATLLAPMSEPALFGTEENTGYFGLVVGTGTNMSTFVDGARLGIQTAGSRSVAVNLESANFVPSALCDTDHKLDELSDSPGEHLLEKAVSGKYLGKLFELERAQRSSVAWEGGELVRLVQKPARSEEGELARAILTRSASMVGACLAGAVAPLCIDCRRVIISVEGGLYHGWPEYDSIVQEVANKLTGENLVLDFRKISEANLKGTAVAMLSEEAIE